MLDLTKIKLTDKQIQEIDAIDFYFRTIDLEEFAKEYEHKIINQQIPLFPYLIFSPGISSFNDLKRATINRAVREDKSNNRLFNLHELKYPPQKIKDKLYYNRASYKNQSMFYGGFGKFEALFENPPKQGDLYTISTWKQKEDSNLCYVSIFHDDKIRYSSKFFEQDWKRYEEQLEQLDKTTAAAHHKLSSLIAFFFTRPVNKDKKIEYLLSSHLANMIFESPHNPKVEAILYPSVPINYTATNLAILPNTFDEKFSFVKAEEFILMNNPEGKNQWSSHKIGESISTKDGKIEWETSYLPEEIKRYLHESGVDLSLI